MKYTSLEIFSASLATKQELPLSPNDISAGFPSPADDFLDLKLDLNRELVKNPASTFYARVSGVSMIDDGIDDGDLLVIDKSVTPFDGCLAICYIDGDFTLKRFKDCKEYGMLMPANSNYKPIMVNEQSDFMIWGVVRYVIKKV